MVEITDSFDLRMVIRIVKKRSRNGPKLDGDGRVLLQTGRKGKEACARHIKIAKTLIPSIPGGYFDQKSINI